MPVTGVGICGVVHAVAEAVALRVYGLLITVVVALIDAADTVATADEVVEEFLELVGENVVETVTVIVAALDIDAACGESGEKVADGKLCWGQCTHDTQHDFGENTRAAR